VAAPGAFTTVHHPGTFSVPLTSFTSIDLAAVRRVEIEIAGPQVATLDDVRFAR
jgi:hypothetical protein